MRRLNEEMHVYRVFLDGVIVDEVNYDDNYDSEDVRRDLIHHAGFDPAIEVKPGRRESVSRRKESLNRRNRRSSTRKKKREASVDVRVEAEAFVEEYFDNDYEQAFFELIAGLSDDEVKYQLDQMKRLYK